MKMLSIPQGNVSRPRFCINYTGLLKIGIRFRQTSFVKKIGTFTEIRYTCEPQL